MWDSKNSNNLLIVKQIIVQLIVASIFSITTQVPASDNQKLTDQFVCEYDAEYNHHEAKNSSDSICPKEGTGIFPNCKCTAANFDYSLSLNRCFRVCPENSTEYWPNCKCFHGGFDKLNFECKDCPFDALSDGIYPNCVCEDENARFNAEKNYCETCPSDSSGTIPNCVCDDGAEYIVKWNQRKKCSYGSTGIHPNCVCNNVGGQFNGNYCLYCPRNSQGNFGECICEGNTNYVKDKNLCVSCPYKSVGHYPNCSCIEPLIYDQEANGCYQCPTGTVVYSVKRIQLASNALMIPKAFIQIVYTESGKIFSAYINECYIECGDENSNGLHPNCICDDKDLYYDADEKKCVSFVGRPCPDDSIGIGPDCLCMNENHLFMLSLWECDFEYLGSPYIPGSECPDSSQKWSQCGVSINQKVLTTFNLILLTSWLFIKIHIID